MSRQLSATLHGARTSFQMLSEEARDYYVMNLSEGRVEDYEPPSSEFLLRFAGAQGRPKWSFVDVGANTGIYTLAVASLCPNARCHAYEPVRQIVEVLQSNIALNPTLKDRISVHNCGISSTKGTLTLTEIVNDQGFISTSSSFEPPKKLAATAKQYPVPTVPLDGEEFSDPVELIKIDVEGHEWDVLAGARKLVQRHRPVIVFEALDCTNETAFNEFAESLGYIFFSFAGEMFRQSGVFAKTSDRFNHILCPNERASAVRSVLTNMGLRDDAVAAKPLPAAIIPILTPVQPLPSTVSCDDPEQMKRCAMVISRTLMAVFNGSVYARLAASNRRLIYVTFATPDYDWGLRVLLRSLRETTTVPIIVLTTSPWEIRSDIADVYCLQVPNLARRTVRRERNEFSNTFTKLWIFGLLEFDRIIFLDSDFLVLKSLDALFDGNEFLVSRDSVERAVLGSFNSGLLAFSPRTDYWERVTSQSATAPSSDGGDQGLLNHLFCDDVKYISSDFNLLKHYWYYAPSEIDRTNVKGIHFIVKKPWHLGYSELTDGLTVDLEDIWTNFLTRSELLQLVSQWRRRQFLAERNRFDVTRNPEIRRWRRRSMRWLVIAIGLFIAGAIFGRLM